MVVILILKLLKKTLEIEKKETQRTSSTCEHSSRRLTFPSLTRFSPYFKIWQCNGATYFIKKAYY